MLPQLSADCHRISMEHLCTTIHSTIIDVGLVGGVLVVFVMFLLCLFFLLFLWMLMYKYYEYKYLCILSMSTIFDHKLL